jgi:glycerate kinase
MRILIAPDSFKGSLSAVAVADAIEQGLRKVVLTADIKKIPMADGGEGTVEAIITAAGGDIHEQNVIDPLGEEVKAFFGVLDDGTTAVIEMAAASGLPLVPEDKRNPMNTTTYGTGQLIKAAMDKGCNHIIIGIGGSATNDGGVGMAQALGVKFYDAQGRIIDGFGGKVLEHIAHIDISAMDKRVKDIDITVACDVTNPLCGSNGAAAVYGPQKGATPEMVEELDRGLANLAVVIKKDLGIDIKDMPGAGAAGGLGAGLVAFLGASLKPGMDIMIDVTHMDELVSQCDLVITGEGRTDEQTVFGKVPVGVASVAKRHGKPVVCLSGSLGDAAERVYEHGVDALFSIIDRPMALADAMSHTSELLERSAISILRLFLAARSINS